MTDFAIPTNTDFLAESLRFLRTCEAHCSCRDGWHFVWSAFKASGRRRSVYYQQPLLQQLLAPAVPAVRNVLIAGSADAGILSVLASVFGDKVRYVAFDLCNAPLVEMRQYAREHGLDLTCSQASLLDYHPQETFDLIFVHNTLCFLGPADALTVLQRYARHMHAGSWLACGMRYEQHPVGLDASAAAELARDIRQMIPDTYAGHADLIALIEPHVEAYSEVRCAPSRHRYAPAQFEAMCSSAGLVAVDSYTDERTPTGVLNIGLANSDIRSDVYLLQRQTGFTDPVA